MHDKDVLPETRLKPTDRVPKKVRDAAAKVADAGGTARDQLDAARKAAGVPMGYVGHIGKRERERQLARMAKQQAKAAGNGS